MMKNTKFRRILLLLACAVLLVSLSVGATLAYLTSTTETVTNTFTVGNVAITLDELQVDEYGVKEQVPQLNEDGTEVKDDEGNTVMVDKRVMTNAYKLIPGHEYIKDPTVHVAEGSEDGWLFVKVVNGISAIEADGNNTIAAQMTAKGWAALGENDNIYYYAGGANGGKVKAGDDIVVFEKFVLKGEGLDGTTIDTYKNETITVQAYIVQADGFDTAADAYAKAPCNAWETAADDNDDNAGGDTTGA